MEKKKLIEVALPLEAINAASAREKSIRHGHPSTLHLWWSRKPTATARAVIWSSLVDDPSSHPEQFPTEETQEKELAIVEVAEMGFHRQFSIVYHKNKYISPVFQKFIQLCRGLKKS